MLVNGVNFFNTQAKYRYSSDFSYKMSNVWDENKNDEVSFSGSTGADGNMMRKRLAGMHCPCCGIKMLTGSDLKSATSLPADAPSKTVLPKLKRFENSLHNVEQGVYNILELQNQKHPEYNLRQLLDTIRAEHLDYLRADEQKIIERIRLISGYLSKNSEQKLHDALSEAGTLIDNKDYAATFKRRAFIGKIGDVVSTIPEKDAGDIIFEVAHEMPRAGNSISAFIVKYSEKNPATGAERTSHDIIRGLLMPSIATVEHVRAHSPLVPNGGGADEMRNYLLECARDNNMRDCMLFRDFVRSNPQFPINAQRYIDAIIARINAGELRGFERYPLQISRTLRRQSKGKIKLDISALNPPAETSPIYKREKAEKKAST